MTSTARVWEVQSLATSPPKLPKEAEGPAAEKPLEQQADADKGGLELQGEWLAVEFRTSGTSAPAHLLENARLEIKADHITWYSGKGDSNRKSTFKLDPSKSPKQIDITILDAPNQSKTALGIYELQKGRLRICHALTKDRPKDFKTERGELRELVVLERAKPK